MQKLILLLFLQILIVNAFSQVLEFHRQDTLDANKTHPRYHFWEGKYYLGAHLPSGAKGLQDIEANPFSAISARWGVQTYGRRAWQQLSKYPSYGFGIYQAFYHPQQNSLGNPSSVYFFYNQPLALKKKFTVNYDFEFGLSYNFAAYHPEENPEQTAIGSKENVHFGLSIESAFKISDRLDARIGFGVLHYSNGRSRTPNKGMNLVQLSTTIRYNTLGKYVGNNKGTKTEYLRPTIVKNPLPEYKPRWEYYTFGNIGIATPSEGWEDQSIYYKMASFGIDAARHYSHRGKFGAGFDYFYDESLSESYGKPVSELSTADKSVFGIHFGHELMFYRWTLVTQYGILLNKRDIKGNWYGRVAFRYDVSDHFFLRGGLKVPAGFVADFIELGGGFYLHQLIKK